MTLVKYGDTFLTFSLTKEDMIPFILRYPDGMEGYIKTIILEHNVPELISMVSFILDRSYKGGLGKSDFERSKAKQWLLGKCVLDGTFFANFMQNLIDIPANGGVSNEST